MTNKMTKRDMFTAIKANLTDPEQIAFIEHEIELLAKRNSKSGKPTAKQTENENLKAVILSHLSDVPVTIGELMKADGLVGNSNQKLTALMSALVRDGKAVRTVEKRVAYFTLAE